MPHKYFADTLLADGARLTPFSFARRGTRFSAIFVYIHTNFKKKRHLLLWEGFAEALLSFS
jgi:hypothetical protein